MNVGLIKLEALSWRLVKTAVPHDPTIIRFDSIHGRTHRLSLRRALRPVASLRIAGGMGGGTGGYRGYMYPPPFLEGGYKRVHSVKVCVYPVVR